VTARHAGPTALVLGAAAGGGFPQWNCGCRLCQLARNQDPRVRPASQASVAVTADGNDWLVVGASPDIRQQISQSPQLWPRNPGRDSPITGVVLTGGDIDAIAGLLVLRERQPFTIYAPGPILDLLSDNDVFGVLDPAVVQRVEVGLFQPTPCGPDMTVTLLPMPGKVPLYRESDRAATEAQAGPAYAAVVRAAGSSIAIAIACAQVTDEVLANLQDADVLFFDGTLFTDDEMIAAGLSEKTSARMGHIPISGPSGSLARLAGLPVPRRIFLHINNTNPILLSDSSERQQVEAAGWQVAYDGMEVSL
jgi:pyrroloquinoline quinone biosynthesis protein B